jgi:SPP1 gp7 family putative phage head morphogenesis protein
MNMIATCEHTEIININAYDPSRTTGLRNTFARNMARRFNELIQVIRRAIIGQDCFGLNRSVISFQLTPPGNKAFDFTRSSDKVSGFMNWLNEQVEKGMLEVKVIPQIGMAAEQPWTNVYIQDSYKRGVIRARYELQKAGFENIPSIEQTGGINISLNTPVHADRLGLLYTRTFNDLKGVTNAMDLQISRVLAQGIADGDNPRLIARKLVSTINGAKMGELGITDTLGRFIPAQRRADILARTEIIRAHAEAQLIEYQNWAVEGVTLKAEFMTAGDERVCDICGSMQGDVYKLEEASGVIPVHPRCRCIWIPFKQSLITGRL